MFGKLDKQNIKQLSKLDLQQKNKFKLLLLPSKEGFSLTTSGVTGSALALGGNFITTLYCQSVTFPSSLSIEYDDFAKFAKSLNKPEEVQLTLLEDEKGTVWRYLQTWRKTVAFASPPRGSFLESSASVLFSSRVEYVFADNQASAERTGILLLGNVQNLKYKFPRIMLYGLKFKGLEDVTASYTEEGNLIYTLKLSVNEVAAPLV